MNRTFSEGSRRLFRDSYQPFTNAVIAATVLVFLGYYVYKPLFGWLVAPVPPAWMQPWRILTYSLVTGNIISLIFGGLLLFTVGGSLERGWGTKTIAIFYALVSVVTALSFTLAARLFGAQALVPGELVFAALLVAFCTLNPDETFNIYGIIPIKTRYIAAGVCVITFFTFGWNNPILGLLALVGCGFAVLWVKQDWAYRIGQGNFPVTMKIPQAPKRPNLRIVPPTKPRDDRFTARDLSPARWLKKRSERRKFEKLMKDD